ncbi:hypothetical protein LXL04_029426 [Taraxacum kok-saghyz]
MKVSGSSEKEVTRSSTKASCQTTSTRRSVHDHGFNAEIQTLGEKPDDREATGELGFAAHCCLLCSRNLEMESLPLGFRFRPTDEELINYYLRQKINGHHSEVHIIPEVDVCKLEPWDLPDQSVIKTDDPEWFFFCPRDRKYPNGHRSNRATSAGYWKATGKDRTIKTRGRSDPKIIGMKKTLVFYRGRAPKGERTHWIMHEYRPTEPDLDGTNPGQTAYVLCRLFRKSDEINATKYDEAEPSSLCLSPTTHKSSPENPPLVFLPSPLDLQTTDGMDPVSFETRIAEIDKSLQTCPEIGAHLDSRFANDFGTNNGLDFQDGTCEPDVSLSELLHLLQNGTESQKNSAVGPIQTLPQGVPIINTDVAFLEPSGSRDGSNMGRPEIKIRTRHPQTDPNPETFVGQGTASRRIRLQIEPSSLSSTNGDGSDNHEETSSTVSEVGPTMFVTFLFSFNLLFLLQVCDIGEDTAITSDVCKHGLKETDQRLRSQSRQIQIQPLKLVRAYCGGQFLSSSLFHIMSVLVVILVMVVSLGVAECPIFHV